MKSQFLIVFLLLITVFSCDKKNHKDIFVGGDSNREELDTSFLKLGKLGVVEGKSTIEVNDNIIVLSDDQNITFINQNEGIISISNFEENSLREGNILVGNKNDKHLLEVISNTDSTAIVKLGNIASLVPGENKKIQISATPKIFFDEIAQPTMEVINNDKEDSQSGDLQIGETTTGLKDKASNLINFKNYELIKGDESQYIDIVGSRVNPTDLGLELEKNGDFSIEIEEGKVEFIPTFRGDFELGFLKVKNLESSIDALIKYRFKIKIKTDGKLTGKVTFPLFKELVFPIKVQAGYVPVYAEVKVEFPAGLSFDIKGDGEYSFVVESEYAFSSQINYRPDTGSDHKSYSDYVVRERKFDLNQTTNNYQFELFIEPKIATNLYRVLGPFANIHTGLQADVKFPLPKGEDDLFFNFNGQVGIQVLDPIWEETVFEDRTPTLFNISRGWDILGPKEKTERTSGTLNDVNLQIDSLGQDNCVGINLRSDSLDRLTTVAIYKNPQFGTLLKDDAFNLNGKVRYCPPANIEGQDSFQITYTTKGKVSNPARMVLNLGENAKKQASEVGFSRSMVKHTSRGEVQLKVPNNAYSKPTIIKSDNEKIIPIDDSHDYEINNDVVYRVKVPKLVDTIVFNFTNYESSFESLFDLGNRNNTYKKIDQELIKYFKLFNKNLVNFSDKSNLLIPYSDYYNENDNRLENWDSKIYENTDAENYLKAMSFSINMEPMDYVLASIFSSLKQRSQNSFVINNIVIIVDGHSREYQPDMRRIAEQINYILPNAVTSIIVNTNNTRSCFTDDQKKVEKHLIERVPHLFNFSKYLNGEFYNTCNGHGEVFDQIFQRVKTRYYEIHNIHSMDTIEGPELEFEPIKS